MALNDKIKDEKIQNSMNREVGRISALSSGKNDKQEYLTSEEILLSNQKKIIEQTKRAYSPIGRTLKNKHKKAIEDTSIKQAKTKQELKNIC